MLSIIYPFRDRDLQRVERSLNSLKDQTDKSFKVEFIDYGSSEKLQEEVSHLCKSYGFVTYSFVPTQLQPWNKSKALNAIIKTLDTDFCFVADVDIIFSPRFVEKVKELQVLKRTTYFQVGFLPSNKELNKGFSKVEVFKKSSPEATGLTMFPVSVLKELNGFDEFYHCWGAEDTDMHLRIRNAGYNIEFYDREILLFHQWHPSYRSRESEKLTKEYRISGIVELNHQHLKHAKLQKTTVVNSEGWGCCPAQKDISVLLKSSTNLSISNEKRQLDDIIFGQLPAFKGSIYKVEIKKDPFPESPKYILKSLFGLKVPSYYTMKEVNDIILQHLISSYRNNPYIYIIGEDKKSIVFAVQL